MSDNKRKIKFILTGALLSAVAGLAALLFILIFSLKSASLPFSGANFSTLYKTHGIYYLLNLLPLLTAIAGGYLGLWLFSRDEKAKNKISYYQTTIRKIIDFVRQIEKNNLNVSFTSVNGEKELEEAMESMRVGLIAADQRENERNEINRLTSETNILLQSYSDIHTLSEGIITFLVKKLDGIVQGAFYVVEGEEEHEKTIRMKASYAYNRKKYMHAEFRFAQGLVGQAAVEKDNILRTEIPDDYMTITSGLIGDRKPTSLLITPLISNDIVYGVIELASFRKFSPLQIHLINELSEVIARTIAKVKITHRTLALLEESEKMRAELSFQKKQLIQNAEDLIKTQEELKESKNNGILEKFLEMKGGFNEKAAQNGID